MRAGLVSIALGGLGACNLPKPKPPEPAKPLVERVVAPPRPVELPFPATSRGTIPADDPAWLLADGYRLSPVEYGEPDWDHVRIHALTHLSLVGRDRARGRAVAGDWKTCALRYHEAEALVRAVELSNPAVVPVANVLADGLGRDGALCAALAEKQAPVVPATGGVAMYRARYLGLASRAAKGADVRRAASTLAAEIATASAANGPLTLVPPAEERDPAAQSLWLASAWVDTVDPIAMTEPWGGWSVNERPRQIKALRAAVGAMASGEVKRLPTLPAALLAPQPEEWSVAEFASVPLADGYVDIGGFAAVHAVPRLTVQDEEDPGWKSWVGARAERMAAMRAGEVPRTIRASTAELLERKEASRYFNILGFQNAAIRQLARGAHYEEALEVLRMQSPPTGLDWYAPDRAAVLLGLEGRLLALMGHARADRVLAAAMDESAAFLAFVDMRAELDRRAAAEAERERVKATREAARRSATPP